MAEWADLSEGLLDLIISKLFDQDRHNFRLVCRSWNAAAATAPYSSNAPCLIYYDREKLLWGFFQYKSFFYRSFPEFDDKAEILCSKHGWLLMCRDNRSPFFFNPFNGHTKPILELHSTCPNWYTSIHFFHPPTSPDCFIIGISTSCYSAKIDILRRGDKNKWKSLEFKSEYEFLVSNSAPVLHHGLVYFVGIRGDLATLDIQSGAWTVYPKSLVHRKLRTQIMRHFLLKINGDDADGLYVVFMIHDTETINVFRLMEPEMRWERVKDLGDKMLYLTHTSSYGDVANPKSMANTVCFPIFDPHDNLLFYSLETRRYHSFQGNHFFDNSIGLTRLHGAAWITPIPTHQLSTNFIWYSDDEV